MSKPFILVKFFDVNQKSSESPLLSFVTEIYPCYQRGDLVRLHKTDNDLKETKEYYADVVNIKHEAVLAHTGDKSQLDQDVIVLVELRS